MRDGALPAAVIAAAVIAFVGYVSFQGASHSVDFAVTGSDLAVVPATDALLPPPWQERARDSTVMVIDVSWQAGEAISAGSYAVMVNTPPGWQPLGCRPVCEWSDDEGLREFAHRLPRRPNPVAATFEAEETGAVQVAFRSPGDEAAPADAPAPAAWLVQTNGDDVLGAERIPLS